MSSESATMRAESPIRPSAISVCSVETLVQRLVEDNGDRDAKINCLMAENASLAHDKKLLVQEILELGDSIIKQKKENEDLQKALDLQNESLMNLNRLNMVMVDDNTILKSMCMGLEVRNTGLEKEARSVAGIKIDIAESNNFKKENAFQKREIEDLIKEIEKLRLQISEKDQELWQECMRGVSL